MGTKPYNGHHCWNCWNVSFWILNDECLYNLACELLQTHKPFRRAVSAMMGHLEGRTPDGANWTRKAVSETMQSLQEG